MHIVRAAEHRRMRWKNGAGETVELAISPQNATLATFDWRLSRANINISGPFSLFPDCDRTLCILDGGAIELDVPGRPRVTLSSHSEPFTFAADSPVQATLIGDPVTDLNLIWRRGAAPPRLVKHLKELQIRAAGCVFSVCFGPSELHTAYRSHALAGGDLVVCSNGDCCTVVSKNFDALYCVEIPGERSML